LRDECHLLLQEPHTLVLQLPHLPILRPELGSLLMYSGLIHCPHRRVGQKSRFLCEYSRNFWFHFFLNLMSNRPSAYLIGMCCLQQAGGICCGSLVDNLNNSFRQESHMRWPHLSLAVLLDGISSKHARHSTLKLPLVPEIRRILDKKILQLAYCLAVLVFSGIRPGRNRILSTIERRLGGVVTLKWR